MPTNSYSVKYDPREIKRKIAELPSLYSDVDRIINISANISGARSALSFLYISLYFEYWETEVLIRTIAQKAFTHNYNGEWKTVQDFLETELQTPEQFEEKYIELKGPHDFFGNFLPKAARYSKLLKIRNSSEKIRRKVVYPQYHRGYKDKGSLRLPSDFHGIRPYSDKEDRRKKITHPLLRENFSGVEDGALGTHPREKGG